MSSHHIRVLTLHIAIIYRTFIEHGYYRFCAFSGIHEADQKATIAHSLPPCRYVTFMTLRSKPLAVLQ